MIAPLRTQFRYHHPYVFQDQFLAMAPQNSPAGLDRLP